MFKRYNGICSQFLKVEGLLLQLAAFVEICGSFGELLSALTLTLSQHLAVLLRVLSHLAHLRHLLPLQAGLVDRRNDSSADPAIAILDRLSTHRLAHLDGVARLLYLVLLVSNVAHPCGDGLFGSCGSRAGAYVHIILGGVPQVLLAFSVTRHVVRLRRGTCSILHSSQRNRLKLIAVAVLVVLVGIVAHAASSD